MKTVIPCLLIFLLAACSGTLTTRRIDPLAVGHSVDGVIHYGYTVTEKKSVLDRIRNPKTGQITHSSYEPEGSDAYCEPAVAVEQVVVADYSKPDPDWFETSKFSVALDKGMLSSVNTESTPGAKTAVEVLQGVATLREDVLNGIQAQSEKTDEIMLKNLIGEAQQKTPIRCSSKD